MPWIENSGNAADALTGERIFPRERVFDTGYKNGREPYMRATRTRILKEETIVALAEAAGFKVVPAGDDGGKSGKSGKRVSKSSPRVVREDAGVGEGAPEAGEDPVGGSDADGGPVGDSEGE